MKTLLNSLALTIALTACGGWEGSATIDPADDTSDPLSISARAFDSCLAGTGASFVPPFWINTEDNACALASKYNMDHLLGLNPDPTQIPTFTAGMSAGGNYSPATGTPRTRAASDALAAGQRSLTGKAMRVVDHDFTDPSGWTVDQWLRMGSN